MSEKPKKPSKTPAATKNVGGRPTLYKPEYPDLAYKFCLLGATNEELARSFDVHVDTIKEWLNVYPEFSASVKEGREIADANVANRLYKRAMGYEHQAVKIFANPTTGAEQIIPYTEHYAPDTTACIFWLKNRQKGKWRDKTEQEVTGTMTLAKALEALPDVE